MSTATEHSQQIACSPSQPGNGLPEEVAHSRAVQIRANADLYGIDRWGHGYFGISEQGCVEVKAPPRRGKSRSS
ncbi:MAG: hypothetical protein R3C12_12520 [Planctomycetaceae bacterium]